MPFYSYFDHYDAATGYAVDYVSVGSIGNVAAQGYYGVWNGAGTAQTETFLKVPEDTSYATQMGRSIFGNSSLGYAMHLYDGNYNWVVWDTTRDTSWFDERGTNQYYQSTYIKWYKWVGFGPGN